LDEFYNEGRCKRGFSRSPYLQDENVYLGQAGEGMDRPPDGAPACLLHLCAEAARVAA